MIWFFTPYSPEKKLATAYDNYIKLVKKPDDWVALMDGDAAFLQSDFGNRIQQYIDKYPGTGMFTCYASRCPYPWQVGKGVNQNGDSIRYIHENTVKMRSNNNLKATELKKRIAGHLMVIQKATWTKYRNEILTKAKDTNIQGVDTAISDILLQNNEHILLMEEMQMFHYYRQYSFTEKHILSDKLTVVIRTHSRPRMFERCINSVRKQTHKNIEIIVGVDNKESFDYAQKHNPNKIIELQPRERKSHDDFPPNEYISQLISHVTDGYILILDDDNFIADPHGVEKLFKEIDKELCIYIIRYRYPDGRLFPDTNTFNKKVVKNGGIDWASCVFHSRLKEVTQSKPLYNADYYFINDLVNYTRVTKWINLDLVHTDTPGSDGKPETDIKFTIQPEKTGYDVVYILGKGSKWSNNEIRYSIRSFVKHFKELRNIVVVGERPVFLDGIVHIPCEDRKDVNKDARMMIKIMQACKDSRVSDNFILCCDDTVIMEPLAMADFKGWHEGPVMYDAQADMLDHRRYGDNSGRKPSEWFEYVYNTGRELKRKCLPDNNYDKAHAPQPINKAEFIQILSSWDMVKTRYTISNIYNNSTRLFKGENIRGKNLKIYGFLKQDEINRITAGKTCINYNDNGLNEDLKDWLSATFPNPTEFEILMADTGRRAAAVKWFEGGCKYDEGVLIFKYLAPRNQRLIRYFELKKGNKVAELKLKHTIELWLH